MTTGTVNLKIQVDTEGLKRGLAQVRWAVGCMGIAFGLSFRGSTYRQRSEIEEGRRKLALAREIQADYPSWDVQVVTGNDGTCRLISRPLGGWA